MHIMNLICDLFRKQFPMPPWGNELDSAKWSFLNGYRGFLAIWVVLAHIAPMFQQQPIFRFPMKSVRVISVSGFFVLSAFLLTYRLLKDLSKPSTSLADCVTHITKYTIRRFFRIYVVFIVFLLLNKYISFFNVEDSYAKLSTESWLTLLTLQRPIVYIGHLWTVPIEIEYYFVIPVICVLCALIERVTGRLWIALMICIAFCAVNTTNNLFNVTHDDLIWNTNRQSSLRIKFQVFFYGSVAAILYTILEANESFIKLVRNSPMIQNLICTATVCSIYICCRYLAGYYYSSLELYLCDSIAALIWGLVIVLMILGHPNFVTNFFAQSRFLTSYGQYSFGAYLWHVFVIFIFWASDFLDIVDMRGEIGEAFFSILISYCVGYLFFCLIENQLMKFANYLCKKVDEFSESKKRYFD
jgi:peptidoglycan/LPS O-acetylase OafA/YrhL